MSLQVCLFVGQDRGGTLKRPGVTCGLKRNLPKSEMRTFYQQFSNTDLKNNKLTFQHFETLENCMITDKSLKSLFSSLNIIKTIFLRSVIYLQME